MKLREHRGGLAESMETTIEIVANMRALREHINKELSPNLVVTEGMLHVEPYGFDDRIKWHTFIVTIDGYGVFGFTDAMPVP
jgi:hypothetical protein